MSNISPEDIYLNFTSPDYGEVFIQFKDLDSYLVEVSTSAIIFGVRFGAAFIVMVLLALLMNKKKRASPMFILNQLALLFLIVHTCLYYHYLLGRSASITTIFSGVYIYNATDINMTIATNSINIILVTIIQGTLLYQMYLIYLHGNILHQKKLYKNVAKGFFALSILTALTDVAFYLNVVIKRALHVKGKGHINPESWETTLPTTLFTVSIALMSLILILKLAYQVMERKKNGLKQFSIFHILTIMLGQSMVIPIILQIIALATPNSNNLGLSVLPHISILIVTICLPLSSMWATSIHNRNENPSSVGCFNVNNSASSVFTDSTAQTFVDHNKEKGSDLQNNMESFDELRKIETYNSPLNIETPTTLFGMADNNDIENQSIRTKLIHSSSYKVNISNKNLSLRSFDFIAKTTHKTGNNYPFNR
ncbi:alpha-factor pheromone receptor STE2 ASCRUDRAFT_74917 [Ascoidea rubescens DSM 1968]|uniref:Uncharacterized protein n=1 Tax=Ascoidea rubescens DSM 1968 TaxID=1344418 RepID=A0A1D2VLT0_9ASCO|nr:hypothetical protein ASCRUDRAFT_74917 [Ascoidea rubescens DSM 1968]ODV62562.1 hypothetical protein ASCRUDRAFT_74917 [Ascoidea rubescens DSM 1968]